MKDFEIIAGPCSVESEKQIIEIALAVKEAGATFLRGSAFKLRTCPDSFQGLGPDGIKFLIKAKEESGLPVISEISDVRLIDLYQDVDVLQVGERSMQNTDLLKELSKVDKPILLKRGRACTIEELLYSAQYLTDGGNKNVILCERGIRTFETATRNTMDISAIGALHALCNFKVFADPSHGTGRRDLVESMALAAVAAGADGIMLEVHNNPDKAYSDAMQAITPETLKSIVKKALKIRKAIFED